MRGEKGGYHNPGGEGISFLGKSRNRDLTPDYRPDLAQRLT